MLIGSIIGDNSDFAIKKGAPVRMRYRPSGSLISVRSVKGVEWWKAISTPLFLEEAEAVYACGYCRPKPLGVDRTVNYVSCRQTTCALVNANDWNTLVHLVGEFRHWTLRVKMFKGVIIGGEVTCVTGSPLTVCGIPMRL